MAEATFPTPFDGLSVPEDGVNRFQPTDVEAKAERVSDEAANPSERRQPGRIPDTDRRAKPRSPKAHLFVTVCHWTMVTLLTLNLLSGVRIGWGYMNSPFPGIAALADPIAPRGTLLGFNLIRFHVTTAFLMLGVVGVYLAYLFGTPAWRRLRLTAKDLKHLGFMGLKVNGFWRYKQALWSANLVIYWLSFVFIGVLLVTGMGLYRLDWGLYQVLGGYDLTRWLHAVVAYALIPYVVVHMVLQWGFGRFWTIFKAQLYRPHVKAGLIGVVIAVPLAWGVYIWEAVPITLTVKRIPEDMLAPVLDGRAYEAVWSQAQQVTVHTTMGANNPEEHVDVDVKALHDDQYVYFQMQWDDPEASYKRFPLQKTTDGWRVLQTAKDNSDETVYYEDKISLYITDEVGGSCADTCHIGVGPHAEKGEKHGLHYTDGWTADVWHWKSVRTNPMGARLATFGFADDQYFGPATPVPAVLPERYTAGYYPDPSTAGGYRYNYEKLDPDKSLGQTFVRPLMLPLTDEIRPNPDPTTSENGVAWWIHEVEGIPYSEEADTFPVGSLIPNIILAPFEGDRADVRAMGAWQAGRWTVEARRALDTKSEYDVAFVPGKPVYLSVAPYNRAQTRHSEHIKPIEVILEQ